MKLEKFADFIDFKPDTESVDDQLSMGSCVAHAGQTMLEIAFKRAGQPIDFSRMYLYYFVQQYAGTLGTTGGGWPTQLGPIVEDHGVCRESVWPYDESALGREPSAVAKSEARLNIPEGSTTFGPLNGVHGIKQALNRGQPVVVTMYVHPGFVGLKGENWREHEWVYSDMPVGMHAVTVIGYDEASGRLLAENSWGSIWGDGGFFGIPYDYYNTKCVLESYAFKKLPVPFVDVEGYQRQDPCEFDPATGLLTIPSINYLIGGVNGTAIGVTLKLKDHGKLTVNSPRWAGGDDADACYFLPEVKLSNRTERHLGLGRVKFQGQEFSNVVLINPDFELVSVEGA